MLKESDDRPLAGLPSRFTRSVRSLLHDGARDLGARMSSVNTRQSDDTRHWAAVSAQRATTFDINRTGKRPLDFKPPECREISSVARQATCLGELPSRHARTARGLDGRLADKFPAWSTRRFQAGQTVPAAASGYYAVSRPNGVMSVNGDAPTVRASLGVASPTGVLPLLRARITAAFIGSRALGARPAHRHRHARYDGIAAHPSGKLVHPGDDERQGESSRHHRP